MTTEKQLNEPIIIHVTGGKGDVLCAEPAIRYAIKYILTDSDIIVIATDAPIFFEHLANEDERVNILPGIFIAKNIDLFDKYKVLATYEHPNVKSKGLLHAAMHSVDYSSIHLLGALIPEEHRKIRLKKPTPEEIEIVKEKFNYFGLDVTKTLLVHPGETWPSRTIPADWWQEFIDLYPGDICIVGANRKEGQELEVTREEHESPGYSPGLLEINDVVSIANYLNLKEFLIAIYLAKGVITNDSLPVHIAGAFNNWLFTFATARRWDTLKPYGHDRAYDLALGCVFPPSHFKPTITTGRYDLLPKNMKSITEILPDPVESAQFVYHKMFP